MGGYTVATEFTLGRGSVETDAFMMAWSKIFRIAAWAALAMVLIATISPAELRPHVWTANKERFIAFAICGGLFAMAYPRRWVAIVTLVILSAGLFELAQFLVPHRHPALKDFVVKVAGGGIGVAGGLLAHRFLGSWFHQPKP